MISHTLILSVFLLPCILGDFTRNIFTNFNQFDSAANTAGGNAAAAGNAGALGLGSAASINEAHHQANLFQTDASGLSSNMATGFNPMASGAASANGQVVGISQHENQFNQQFGASNFRFRRGVQYYPALYPYPYGGQSNVGASAVGGGSALQGIVRINNNAYSNSHPGSATGVASGNAMGEGYGVNIFQASESNANTVF